MLGNLFNKAKSFGSKVLGVGGNVIRKIGDIGGQAARTLGQYGTIVGTGLGGVASALTGNPDLLLKGSQIGSAVERFAKSKPVANVIRGANDIGNVASSGSQYLSK